jgi:poly(3-hydroxybutyrate) depolymerase
MSCSSRENKNTIIDPLFSQRTSLRLTQEKLAGAMVGTSRAQQMNDATLRTFLLRRNNQPTPVVYNDVIKRRSSPGGCFSEGNIFKITDLVTPYVLRDDNDVLRTGSYYISSTLLGDVGTILDVNTPILFFFRGESKTYDADSSRDIYYLKDIYSNGMTNKILISMHPLTSNDGSYNYDVFDNSSGILYDRLGNVDDVASFEDIIDQVRTSTGLDAASPIYARGHSSGGEFCYRLAKENLVDGIIVSGANYIVDNLEIPTYASTFDISFVFIIHGVNDTLVPYDNSYSQQDFSYNETPSSLGIEYYDTIDSANAWLSILRNNDNNDEDIDTENSSSNLINIGTETNVNNLELVVYEPSDNINFRLWRINEGTHNIPKQVEMEIMNEIDNLIN